MLSRCKRWVITRLTNVPLHSSPTQHFQLLLVITQFIVYLIQTADSFRYLFVLLYADFQQIAPRSFAIATSCHLGHFPVAVITFLPDRPFVRLGAIFDNYCSVVSSSFGQSLPVIFLSLVYKKLDISRVEWMMSITILKNCIVIKFLRWWEWLEMIVKSTWSQYKPTGVSLPVLKVTLSSQPNSSLIWCSTFRTHGYFWHTVTVNEWMYEWSI